MISQKLKNAVEALVSAARAEGVDLAAVLVQYESERSADFFTRSTPGGAEADAGHFMLDVVRELLTDEWTPVGSDDDVATQKTLQEVVVAWSDRNHTHKMRHVPETGRYEWAK